MFCTKCGKEQQENANFCAYCGVRLRQKTTVQPTVDATNVLRRTFCTACGKCGDVDAGCCDYCGAGGASLVIVETSKDQLEWEQYTKVQPRRKVPTPKQSKLDLPVAPTPSGGVLTRCQMCGKLVDPLERRDFSSVGLHSLCVRCLQVWEEFEELMRKWGPLPKEKGSLSIKEMKRDEVLQMEGLKMWEDFFLWGRRVRDAITGQSTSTRPMPDLTTRAGRKEANKEAKETDSIIRQFFKRLK